MAETTSAIPVGVYPYLTVKGGKAAIEFYTRAFGAVVVGAATRGRQRGGVACAVHRPVGNR